MSQYCTQCGAENDNDAKFCKSCGLPLALKTEEGNQPAEQVEQSAEPLESKVEQTALVEPMKLSMLWIFPTIWMIYHFIFVMHGLLMPFELMPETIASSFGSGFAILLIPLLVTGIIRLVKKVNDTTYPNFVKHTFIGTVITFFLAIAGHINTRLDESSTQEIAQADDSLYQVAPVAEELSSAKEISEEREIRNYWDKFAASWNDKKKRYDHPEQGIEYLSKIIEIKPNDSFYLNSRGLLYDQLQRYDLALKDLTEALRFTPDDTAILNNRGYIYLELENISKAKKDAIRACQLGDCQLKKEIIKLEKENTRPAEEYAPAADPAPLDEEIQGTANE